MTDEAERDYLWGKRHDVLCRVQISVLYHQKRERFFDVLEKLAKAVAVIGGSAAFARIGGAEAMPYVAAAITVTSTVSLVFGFSERSRRHADLARGFRQIEADIAAKGERDFAEPDVTGWVARTISLECGEPPALGALVTICQNELAAAQGQREMIVPLPLWKRMLAQVVDLSVPAHTA